MAALGESADHVGTHPTQPDHPQLHRSSLRVSLYSWYTPMRLSAEIIRDKPDRLARRFARIASQASAESIEARGRFTIAIPGGSVAEAFLPALATANLHWGRLEVFWTD